MQMEIENQQRCSVARLFTPVTYERTWQKITGAVGVEPGEAAAGAACPQVAGETGAHGLDALGGVAEGEGMIAMNTVHNPRLLAFYGWLRSIGSSQAGLARSAGCGRCHLSQVLSGRLTGGRTWPRVFATVPPEGLAILEQSSAWNYVVQARFERWGARRSLRAKAAAEIYAKGGAARAEVLNHRGTEGTGEGSRSQELGARSHGPEADNLNHRGTEGTEKKT